MRKQQKQLGCIYKTQVNEMSDMLWLILFIPFFKEFIEPPVGRCYRAKGHLEKVFCNKCNNFTESLHNCNNLLDVM